MSYFSKPIKGFLTRNRTQVIAGHPHFMYSEDMFAGQYCSRKTIRGLQCNETPVFLYMNPGLTTASKYKAKLMCDSHASMTLLELEGNKEETTMNYARRSVLNRELSRLEK